MSLIDIENEQFRRDILSLLQQDADYALNDGLLQSALTELGSPIAYDRLQSQLAWLAEQGLVTLAKLPGTVVATLTVRGEDIAAGRAMVPGVKRLRPGDYGR